MKFCFLFLFSGSRSIKSISSIISVSDSINKNNLKNRIPLPENKDELYTLSKTINNLLDRIENAIEREKQIKGWSRKKKQDLINSLNPEWDDLYSSLC